MTTFFQKETVEFMIIVSQRLFTVFKTKSVHNKCLRRLSQFMPYLFVSKKKKKKKSFVPVSFRTQQSFSYSGAAFSNATSSMNQIPLLWKKHP